MIFWEWWKLQGQELLPVQIRSHQNLTEIVKRIAGLSWDISKTHVALKQQQQQQKAKISNIKECCLTCKNLKHYIVAKNLEKVPLGELGTECACEEAHHIFNFDKICCEVNGDSDYKLNANLIGEK